MLGKTPVIVGEVGDSPGGGAGRVDRSSSEETRTVATYRVADRRAGHRITENLGCLLKSLRSHYRRLVCEAAWRKQRVATPDSPRCPPDEPFPTGSVGEQTRGGGRRGEHGVPWQTSPEALETFVKSSGRRGPRESRSVAHTIACGG